MAKTRAPSSKKKPKLKKGSVDFKKIKRKVGRKLPPPKNATNTEIKSRAIVLPEQSVASDKTGLAVSKKGLTLKELLIQTSHHKAKARKDALFGMKDLFVMHPIELRQHGYAIIEKLRERFSDDDKIVRDTLYQILKSVILPGCKEDVQGPLASLMMPYIFNAMTHLAVDIRLMAFKFLDITIQYYPPSFFMHAEKILQNYEDIFRLQQINFHEKGKFSSLLSTFLSCLLLLPQSQEDMELSKKDAPERNFFHAYELFVPRKSSNDFVMIEEKLISLLIVLVDRFKDLISVPHSVSSDAKNFECIHLILQSINSAVQFLKYSLKENPSASSIWCNHIAPLLLKRVFAVFPLSSQSLADKVDEKSIILNTDVTEILHTTYECIQTPSDVLEKFLIFIEDTLLGNGKNNGGIGMRKLVKANPTLILISFIPKLVGNLNGDWKYRLVQALTSTFKDCHPESSLKLACLKAMSQMLVSQEDVMLNDSNSLDLMNHWIAWIRLLPELLIHNQERIPSVSKVVLKLLLHLGQRCGLNLILKQEYDNLQNPLQQFYSVHQNSGICYGPFIKLPRDSQELAVSCLAYFSRLEPFMLTSLAACCTSNELEQSMLSRTIGAMESAYHDGRIWIADYISFLCTVICRFPVSQGPGFNVSSSDAFKSLTREICSSLSRMGDTNLLHHMIERLLLNEISKKLPVDNMCSVLKVLNTLDSAPSMLSRQSITVMRTSLLDYLIDVVQRIPLDDQGYVESQDARTLRYYLLPCHILFLRSDELLNLVLTSIETMVKDSPRVDTSRSDSSKLVDVVFALVWLNKNVKTKKLGDLSEQLYSLKKRLPSSLIEARMQKVC